MTRLRRWLFNFAAVVSVVLCVATVVLCVRSCFAFDFVRMGGLNENPEGYAYNRFAIYSAKGFVRVQFRHGVLKRDLDPGVMETMRPAFMFLQFQRMSYPFAEPNPAEWSLGWAGLELRGSRANSASSERNLSFTVPYLLIIAGFSVLLIVQISRALRQRRLKRAGLCAKCGYDLRATPERCPECGTIPMEESHG